MSGDEAVLRPGDHAVHAIAPHGDRHADAALLEGVAGRAGGEEQERALRAEQVGHAHRAQLGAVEAIRREGDRHPQDGAPDPPPAEQRPERRRAPQVGELGAVARDQVLADPEEALDLADAGRGQPRQVGAAIAIEEVEDVVAGRVRAGAERRPRHRRQRRVGGLQPPVGAGGGEPGEVGQPAFGHEAIGEPGILAVEADHDQPSERRRRRTVPAHQAPQRAERPGQHRRDHDQQGDEHHQERRHHREPGAGADVGQGGGGQQQHRGGRGHGRPARVWYKSAHAGAHRERQAFGGDCTAASWRSAGRGRLVIADWVRRLRAGAPIVVVSGLPRSGTSMMMRVLAAGGVPTMVDGIRTADVSNPNGYFEFEPVKGLDKAGDLAWLPEARGKAVKIISFLLTHLPETYDYQVLFMHRDLAEVMASQRKMLAQRGEPESLADEAGDAAALRRPPGAGRPLPLRPAVLPDDADPLRRRDRRSGGDGRAGGRVPGSPTRSRGDGPGRGRRAVPQSHANGA